MLRHLEGRDNDLRERKLALQCWGLLLVLEGCCETFTMPAPLEQYAESFIFDIGRHFLNAFF